MNTSGIFHSGGRAPARIELDVRGAYRSLVEFESVEDYAGDADEVARIIERDGMIAPDFGSLDLD